MYRPTFSKSKSGDTERQNVKKLVKIVKNDVTYQLVGMKILQKIAWYVYFYIYLVSTKNGFNPQNPYLRSPLKSTVWQSTNF